MRSGEDDRGLARVALIEGDASVTMLAWMFQHLTPQEIQDYLFGTEIPDTVGHPGLDGEPSSRSRTTRGSTGRWRWPAAIRPTRTSRRSTRRRAEPPASTEQIVDLEKWDARESPRAVEVPDLATALGAGWEEVDDTPIGQASIGMMLEYLGVSPVEAAGCRRGLGRRPGGDRDRAG